MREIILYFLETIVTYPYQYNPLPVSIHQQYLFASSVFVFVRLFELILRLAHTDRLSFCDLQAKKKQIILFAHYTAAFLPFVFLVNKTCNQVIPLPTSVLKASLILKVDPLYPCAA